MRIPLSHYYFFIWLFCYKHLIVVYLQFCYGNHNATNEIFQKWCRLYPQHHSFKLESKHIVAWKTTRINFTLKFFCKEMRQHISVTALATTVVRDLKIQVFLAWAKKKNIAILMVLCRCVAVVKSSVRLQGTRKNFLQWKLPNADNPWVV